MTFSLRTVYTIENRLQDPEPQTQTRLGRPHTGMLLLSLGPLLRSVPLRPRASSLPQGRQGRSERRCRSLVVREKGILPKMV